MLRLPFFYPPGFDRGSRVLRTEVVQTVFFVSSNSLDNDNGCRMLNFTILNGLNPDSNITSSRVKSFVFFFFFAVTFDL